MFRLQCLYKTLYKKYISYRNKENGADKIIYFNVTRLSNSNYSGPFIMRDMI